jgi:hypothetical protein
MKTIDPLHKKEDILPQNNAEAFQTNQYNKSSAAADPSQQPYQSLEPNIQQVPNATPQVPNLEPSASQVINSKRRINKKVLFFCFGTMLTFLIIFGSITLLRDNTPRQEEPSMTTVVQNTPIDTSEEEATPSKDPVADYLETTCKEFENDDNAINNSRILESKKMIQSLREYKSINGILPSSDNATTVYREFVGNIYLPDCATKKDLVIVTATPKSGDEFQVADSSVCSGNNFETSADPNNFAVRLMLLDGSILCRDLSDFNIQ